MRWVRIAAPDGAVTTRPLDVARINIGRSRDNEIALDDPAVSRQHCLIEVDGERIVVKDRGTANGTFLNNAPLHEPRVLEEGDRLYVGPFLLELVSVAPEVSGAVVRRPMGPIVPTPALDGGVSRRRRRLETWAEEWQRLGRPRRLLLRGRLLGEARRLAAEDETVSEVAKAFVRSAGRAKALRRVAGVLAGGVGITAVAGGLAMARMSAEREGVEAVAEAEEPTAVVAVTPVEPAPVMTEPAVWIEHVVIPAETIEDIARRYDVAETAVARWNGLNVDEPALDVGRRLQIKPKANPLPQQQIEFELDRRYDWTRLAERFDVEIEKLRAYNHELERLERGTRVTVWINPKPYGRRSDALEVPEYDIRPDAVSVGRPNDGRIEHAIKMPKSELYERRAPNIMWGSSHTIETLQTAIAHFRQDVDFDGVVMVADISRRQGGHFPPHKSHQAGRDVDIWMPTLKGVYKENYKGKDRKPQPNEIDWFATWGLVRALIETDQIVHIFLEYELQAKLHHAAKTMGATDEELVRMIQYPRGPYAAGVVGHSAGHTGHIHVRFRCGDEDVRCADNIRRAEE